MVLEAEAGAFERWGLRVGDKLELHDPSDAVSRAAGTLVLVSTPIGNLGDLSPRALETLAHADIVCCEDTRRTRGLLTHAGLKGVRLLSLHEPQRDGAPRRPCSAHLAEGRTVAVVSDAGTPAVSDPGARLVAAAVGGRRRR